MLDKDSPGLNRDTMIDSEPIVVLPPSPPRTRPRTLRMVVLLVLAILIVAGVVGLNEIYHFIS